MATQFTFNKFPAELREQRLWLLWRLEDTDKRQRCKVPKSLDLRNADSTNLGHCATFDAALSALPNLLPLEKYKTEIATGLGCVIANRYVGVDLDHCYDEPRAAISEFAQQFLAALPDTYTELTPSRQGFHLWFALADGVAIPEKLGIRTKQVELYFRDRYLTVTGWAAANRSASIHRLSQAELEKLIELVASSREQKKPLPAQANSEKFQEYMSRHDFADLSAVVHGLVVMLLHKHKLDFDAADAEFRTSAIYQNTHWKEKWQRLGGDELKKCEPLAREWLERDARAGATIDDSDQALTEKFAAAKGDVLHYLTDDKSWWSFEKGLWLERISGPIFDCGEFIKAQEPAGAGKNLHKRLNSEKLVTAVLRLAKDRPEFRAKASDFDHDSWLVGLPEGLALDLTTGEVRAARPDDLLTRALPAIPSDDEPEKSCPRWLQYLEETHPGDRDLQAYLQRYAGYCATSSVREEQVLFLIGRPGAGEGTYTETLQAVLGPYYCQLPLDLLLEDAKEDRRLNHIAELRGKRLGVCNEGARSKKLDRNALKNLTGGGSVTGRRLGHQAFDFPMTTKILIVSNDEPVLDLDDAMKQRVHVVPFNVVFRGDAQKDDKGLKQFLKERELAGIARWLVNGCVEWQRTGLKPPTSVLARTTEYFQNADLVDQFLQECCEFSPEFFTATADLFTAVRKFCENRGEKNAVTHQRLFVPDLMNRRSELRQDRPRGKGFSGESGFWGIRLNEEGRQLISRNSTF